MKTLFSIKCGLVFFPLFLGSAFGQDETPDRDTVVIKQGIDLELSKTLEGSARTVSLAADYVDFGDTGLVFRSWRAGVEQTLDNDEDLFGNQTITNFVFDADYEHLFRTSDSGWYLSLRGQLDLLDNLERYVANEGEVDLSRHTEIRGTAGIEVGAISLPDSFNEIVTLGLCIDGVIQESYQTEDLEVIPVVSLRARYQMFSEDRRSGFLCQAKIGQVTDQDYDHDIMANVTAGFFKGPFDFSLSYDRDDLGFSGDDDGRVSVKVGVTVAR